MMNRLLLSAVLATLAAPSFAAGTCDLLDSKTIEAALGAKVTGTSLDKGLFSEACTYMLSGASGQGMFSLERYTRPIPPGSEAQILMTTGGGKDKIVDLPGIGDKAVTNAGTLDMVLRSGPALYHYNTRGMPCEDATRRDDDIRKRCDDKRLAALSTIGKQLANKK